MWSHSIFRVHRRQIIFESVIWLQLYMRFYSIRFLNKRIWFVVFRRIKQTFVLRIRRNRIIFERKFHRAADNSVDCNDKFRVFIFIFLAYTMTEDINNLEFGQLIDLYSGTECLANWFLSQSVNNISRMLIKKTANRKPNVKENSGFKVFESF